MAGRSIITVVFMVIALTCSFLSSFWCRMVQFNPISINGTAVGPPLKFGLWEQQSTSFYTGTSGSQTTLYALKTCSPYSDVVNVDSKWKAARAFSIIAPVMGILFVGAACVNPDPNLAKSLGGAIIILMTLFQGLTLLVFRSSLCDSVPGADSVDLPNGVLLSEWYPNGCVFSNGTVATIVSIVFWLLTGASLLAMGPVADE